MTFMERPEDLTFEKTPEKSKAPVKTPEKPEILAPAGTFASLKAAVKAGADAVYVGGNMFSARAFAGNFNKDELLRAIDYCHIFDIKIYLAVNTLLKENEINDLAQYVRPFYKEGIDGIIVQDMGVSAMLAREFPDLPLHASTQMSISSHHGAVFLKSLGFTRAVPARELALEEIRAIKEQADIEIETFVHGAMCYCYSGKCLFSSFSGGRSGNRGRCAQPCRKKYEYNGKSEYIMSLKDMCLLETVPELICAGIDSFKIEGRMKKPEYVAAAVRAYREAVDMFFAGTWDEKKIFADTDDMRDIYNRGGFSKGYYFQQNGPSMLAKERPNHTGLKVGTVGKVNPPYIYVELEKDVNAHDVLEIRPGKTYEQGAESGRRRHGSADVSGKVELTSAASGRAGGILKLKGNNFKKISRGMDVYRTRNNALLDEIKKDIIEKEIFITAKAYVTAQAGKPLEVRVHGGGVSVKVTGNIVQNAQNRATTADEVIGKMKKTGGSGVRFETECRIDPDIFIPMSEFNELRRRAAQEYKKALAASYRRQRPVLRTERPIFQENRGNGQAAGKEETCRHTYINVRTREQLDAVIAIDAADVLIVPAHLAPIAAAADAKICIALPDVMRENKLDIIKGMLSDAEAVVIQNIDELGFLKESAFKGTVTGGEFLYAYNSAALAFYKEFFPDMRFIAPAELTDDEIKTLEEVSGMKFIYKAYGCQKLMATAQYLNGPFVDEKGNRFRALHDEINNISEIYMAKPVSMLDKRQAWAGRDILFEFTAESADETAQILKAMSVPEYIRGHHFKGID